MSLECLACYGVENSPHVMRSYSSGSDTQVTCCWSKKSAPPPPSEPSTAATGSRVAPVPPRNTGGATIPRLTRCHAVRRDLVMDWNFEDITEGYNAAIQGR
eukprot:c25298_g1_i2 orf=450-752(+)